MAWGTSKNVNKLLFIVFLHFDVAVKWHVNGHNIFASEHTFLPNEILQIVEQSCFVGISRRAQESVRDAEIYSGLRKAFVEEEMVVIGLIDIDHFVWPSGNSLKFDEGQSVPDKDDINSVIALFPKKIHDRVCLSRGSLHKKEPVAEIYDGIQTIDILIAFINQQCHSYRTKAGYLSIEGLHRQEILGSLFHVQNVTNIDMEQLIKVPGVSYCDKDFCENERIKYSEEGRKKSKEIWNSQSHFLHDSAMNFKDFELNIQKCEQSAVPSKEDFFHRYLKASKPVIFKNAINSWEAMTKWTNEFLKSVHGKNSVHIKLTPLGEFEGVDLASNFENYKEFRIPLDVKEQLLFPDLVVVRPAMANMNLSTFIDTIQSVANGSRTGFSAYLEYSSIADIMPELEEDISELPFIQNLLQLKHLNIWLSDGNTLGKLHFDPFDNLLCQVI